MPDNKKICEALELVIEEGDKIVEDARTARDAIDIYIAKAESAAMIFRQLHRDFGCDAIATPDDDTPSSDEGPLPDEEAGDGFTSPPGYGHG